MNRFVAVAILLAVSGALSHAEAETVRLRVGGDRVGQGWLFLDTQGRCLVATPAHVASADGRLIDPVLIDPKGRESALSDVAQPDLEIDIAFGTVTGETARDACSPSRISPLPLDFAIRGLSDALLTTTSGGEQTNIRVLAKAVSIDQGRGDRLAFSPADRSETLTQGMSGSVILTGDRPIAMLIQVIPEERIGIALRFDAIGRLVARYRPAPTPRKTAMTGAAVTLLAGSTVDPARGPADILRQDGSGFVGRAVRGRLALIVRFDAPRTIKALRLETGDAPSAFRLKRVSLAMSASAGSAFLPARSCDATGRMSPAIDCAVAPRTAIAAKIEVETKDDGDLSLLKLAFD